MTVVNTAYELLQRSGVLSARPAENSGADTEEKNGNSSSSRKTDGGSRFTPKAGLRRRRVPDDFADGDKWSMKSTLEWDTMMNSAFGLNGVSEEELKNPANHPFSHSKFFSFEEDTTIYRMIRGGATVRQVARTLGKPPTFVERRLHNAQFKQRIQYVLRHEKRQKQQRKGATTGGANTTERIFGAGDEFHTALRQQQQQQQRPGTEDRRKKEWEPTVPDWEVPAYFAEMSLEEKGRHARLLREEQQQQQVPSWTRAASKVGRSYSNYARFAGRKPAA
ncbi:hypothetical protein DQ04_05621000 [Trypanosoma grayi]|uniref:hypothetical protein n=1 Tax=Trypanosoma grayi TaxID=71804 RepID=UPI0004F435FD|nr:hypothetical protein DQ04_05621000 [Trypanosoma grayi]KEG09200.1 hypothetical protein DQ04_05621000 [Trypanosoma grayi]